METRETAENTQQPVQSPEEGAPASNRRNFLRQAATVGVSTAALTLLTEGVGSREAKAALPHNDPVTPREYILEVFTIRGQQRVSVSPNDGSGRSTTQPGGKTVTIELGSFDHTKVNTYALWYNVVENLQDLPKFSKLRVDYADANRAFLGIDAELAPGFTDASLTLRIFELSDPVAYR